MLLKQKLESWKRTLERLRDQRNILAAVTRFFAVHQATFVETLAETFHLLSQSSDSSLLRTFTLSVQFAGYSVVLPVHTGVCYSGRRLGHQGLYGGCTC